MIASTETPQRRASDTSRLTASDWEGQPPPLPVVVKTSQIPTLSLLTVT